MSNMIVAAVSGSFNRHMAAVERAVMELASLGVHVASPADPRVVDSIGGFLFVASDRNRSVKLVQDRHLECIRAAHFVWLVCPDGYVGQSASMEVGFAAAVGVPVLSESHPVDLTLRHYVRVVPSIRAAVDHAVRNRRELNVPRFVVDPHASIEEAHDVLERIHGVLRRQARLVTDADAAAVAAAQTEIAEIFAPTC